MNNWTITLALFLFALSGLFCALWQREKRNGRNRAMQAFEKEYRTLQVDHGLAVDKALDLEQELERMIGQRDDACSQRDRLNQENDKLHAQVKLLIETANKQPIEDKGKVDEDTVAQPVTQASTETAPVRNARQRKGAARKEP